MNAIVNYAGKQVTFCDAQPQDYIEGMLLQNRWYELSNLEFIRSLQAVGNYVDVGAYIGTHSLFFSLFCPAVRVYSFEPQPDVYQKLVRNLAANNVINCRAVNAGLSDAIGRGEAKGADTNKGGAWLRPGNAVDVLPLDSLRLPDVTLMKIDVEGMELRVLQGATNTLKNVEHLFVEMWPEDKCKERRSEYTRGTATSFLGMMGIQLQKELVEDLLYFKRVMPYSESPAVTRPYCIHDGYTIRSQNEDWDDTSITPEEQATYQKEVYEFAREIADKKSAKTILDVGCGTGLKLVTNFPEPNFKTIGTELPKTVEFLKSTYPGREWINSETLDDAPQADLVICADVIEHLANPDLLLNFIKRTGAKWLVISTVDRDKLDSHAGPPWNPCHIREWSQPEFRAYISSSLFTVEHQFASNSEQTTQVILCRVL